MTVMTKTILAVLAAKAAKIAEEDAQAARVEKIIDDAITRTNTAITELNGLQYRITKLPTVGNTVADSATIRADGYRLWFMWIGKRLVALVDHSELLGPFNNRPFSKIGESQRAHIPYDDVLEWAEGIYEKSKSFTPCNGEGVPICDVLDDGAFRMCLPGASDTCKRDADWVMTKAAEWLAGIIEPESFNVAERKIPDRRWNPAAGLVIYYLARGDCAKGTPYLEEAFEGHYIFSAYPNSIDGLDRTGTVGVLAKRKKDGRWATATIGSGWMNDQGRDHMDMFNAVMTGVGYPTAWQAIHALNFGRRH